MHVLNVRELLVDISRKKWKIDWGIFIIEKGFFNISFNFRSKKLEAIFIQNKMFSYSLFADKRIDFFYIFFLICLFIFVRLYFREE